MKRLTRWRVPVFTIVALPLIGMAELRAIGLIQAPSAASVQTTCEVLKLRAWGLAGGGRDVFSAGLARDCADAFAVLRDGADATRARPALALLERLELFHRTIAGINADRFAEWRTAGGAPPRPVSRAGEFLIARELGVLDAQATWTGEAEENLAAR